MSLKQILLSVSRFPRELLVPFQIPGWKQRLVELDINCVPSQMITSEVCVCVWACACAATAWADESQIYFGSGAEHIITVISLSDRKSDGEQDMLGPAGWLKNTHEGEQGKKEETHPAVSHIHTHTHTLKDAQPIHIQNTPQHTVCFSFWPERHLRLLLLLPSRDVTSVFISLFFKVCEVAPIL